MTDKIRIEGFDTEPGALEPDAFAETPREQADRLARKAAVARTTQETSRRANDEVVNKRLFALRDQVTALHGRLSLLDVKVDGQSGALDTVAKQMNENTSLTKEIRDILAGGKLIINLVKLTGVIAVPITAIVTAIHVFTKGP